MFKAYSKSYPGAKVSFVFVERDKETELDELPKEHRRKPVFEIREHADGSFTILYAADKKVWIREYKEEV